MQQVNDDMDELFRKAAEDYPLKTDNSNWEKVRKKLVAGSDQNIEPEKNKDYRLLLLLLLLPLGWLGYKYFNSNDKAVTGKDISANKNIVIPKQSLTKTTEENSNSNLPSATIQQPISSQSSVPSKNLSSINFSNNLRTKSPVQNKDQNNIIGEKNNTAINTTTAPASDNKNSNELSQSPENKNTNSEKLTNNKDQTQPASNVTETKPNQQNFNEQQKTEITTSDNTKNSNTEKKKAQSKTEHLYAGIIAGTDVSTVKFQSVKQTGNNIGFLLGYHLNKRLSIEAGVLQDKKYYYSDGKYFNTSKISIPNYSSISQVNGNCNMLELPVSLQYNFKSSSPKHNLFASAGFSSYLMKKENYDYTIVTYGQPYQHSSSYNNSSSFWASDINISAGYKKSIGKTGSLRIEPYARIPIKGVGIGSLPITSVGVNIVLTKKIF